MVGLSPGLRRRSLRREEDVEKGAGGRYLEREARRADAEDPRDRDERRHHERDPGGGRPAGRRPGVPGVRDLGTAAVAAVAGGVQLRVKGDERRRQQREQQVRSANLGSHSTGILHAVTTPIYIPNFAARLRWRMAWRVVCARTRSAHAPMLASIAHRFRF